MILSIILLFFVTISFGQIGFQSTQSASILVDHILHNSVTLNGTPTLQCGSNGTGYFYNGYDYSFTLDSAIILSTGDASYFGRHYSYNASYPTLFSIPDPSLESLTSAPLRDVCILSFNFVPNQDSIIMDYAFGSEEYIEKLGQLDHDVFGVFITGQNPQGGIYDHTNIALVNGYSEPVNIQSINHISQSNLYINNYPQGQLSGLASPFIVLDGFTKSLRTGISVMAGGLYNMKIAIADVGNPYDDSYLFIRKSSIRTLSNVSALPIELSDLSIEKINDGIRVDWYTSYENNNIGFKVLRSSDAILWEEIGFHPGRGVTKEITSYSHVDDHPLDGPNYYRLEQIDKDYNSLFSNVTYCFWDQVTVEPIERWYLSGRLLDILLRDEPLSYVQLDLLTLLGQVIESHTIENRRNTLDFSHLDAGQYLAKIRISNRVFVKKMILR